MDGSNLKQITNYDLDKVGLEPVGKIVNELPIDYLTITSEMLGGITNKFGYICEPKGINLPIFLTVNGAEMPIELSVRGMYELQPETYQQQSYGGVENKELSNIYKTCIINVSEIKVPKDIEFKLDYII